MMIRLTITVAALLIAAPAIAAPAPPEFVYCTVPSTSPRGQGLIVTAIFRSRSKPEFIESAFTNYLRTSYAPYGNGWIFSEGSVSCVSFIDRRDAETQRSLDISRIPQPVQSIFNVIFQLG